MTKPWRKSASFTDSGCAILPAMSTPIKALLPYAHRPLLAIRVGDEAPRPGVWEGFLHAIQENRACCDEVWFSSCANWGSSPASRSRPPSATATAFWSPRTSPHAPGAASPAPMARSADAAAAHGSPPSCSISAKSPKSTPSGSPVQCGSMTTAASATTTR